ncbi:MAG TPA: bluetail domain-containing putative surface protein, partial [Devosia sp.]|nr:bluetail domain-containing putative surface protein [Devosia sp.]
TFVTNADVVFITDLDLNNDELGFDDFGVDGAPDYVADLRTLNDADTTALNALLSNAGSLDEAAEIALEEAMGNVTGEGADDDFAVIFNYGKDTYLVAGDVTNTAGAEVDVVVRITGVTGTFDLGDFPAQPIPA